MSKEYFYVSLELKNDKGEVNSSTRYMISPHLTTKIIFKN